MTNFEWKHHPPTKQNPHDAYSLDLGFDEIYIDRMGPDGRWRILGPLLPSASNPDTLDGGRSAKDVQTYAVRIVRNKLRQVAQQLEEFEASQTKVYNPTD